MRGSPSLPFGGVDVDSPHGYRTLRFFEINLIFNLTQWKSESYFTHGNNAISLNSLIKDTTMAYCTTNYKSKKQFKEAVAAGVKVGVWQPNFMGSTTVYDDTVCVEGPHSPKPHSWYATVKVDSQGVVVSVK